ncbi:hypothetical protein, partial [Desulfovibrio porci]|uniref:hypothetical protein n=1 Tax=Desulfovibrio porci TaxID=2605782 RepID=UPI003A94382C
MKVFCNSIDVSAMIHCIGLQRRRVRRLSAAENQRQTHSAEQSFHPKCHICSFIGCKIIRQLYHHCANAVLKGGYGA